MVAFLVREGRLPRPCPIFALSPCPVPVPYPCRLFSEFVSLVVPAPFSEPSKQVLARVSSLHPNYIDLSLERVYRLAAALGHPHKRLPPVVHVAGTNGKGSTLSFIQAGLEQAGLSVHRYTSPHLVRFHERIVLEGYPIEEAYLADLLRFVVKKNAEQPITFFELTTCAAFLAFLPETRSVPLAGDRARRAFGRHKHRRDPHSDAFNAYFARP